MAARAYWSGYLRLSLVAVPVRLYAATTASERVSLHYVDRETGQRVRYQPVINEDEPIDKARIGKGYEYDKDRYVLIDDEDLQKLKLPTSKTMEIEAFVPAGELDPVYFDKPFYAVPDGDIAIEAYQTILQALEASGRIGIGRIAMGGKERVAAVQPRDGVLMLTTLRGAEEVRRRSDVVPEVEAAPAGKAEVELAQQLIKSKSTRFDPKSYPDRYQTALKQLVEAKLAGKEIEAPAPQHTARIINLMDALKKSVAEAGGKPPAAAADHAAATKKAAGAKKKPPAPSAKRAGGKRGRSSAA